MPDCYDIFFPPRVGDSAASYFNGALDARSISFYVEFLAFFIEFLNKLLAVTSARIDILD